MNLLVIAIGGALGSMCRYVLSASVLRVFGTLFPAGTFVVNILACLFFGLIAGGAHPSPDRTGAPGGEGGQQETPAGTPS